MKKKILFLFLFVFTLWLIFSVGRQVYSLFQAGKRISLAEQKILLLEKERKRLREELAKRDTKEFIEKEARDKLGLAKEGETIAILPKKFQTEPQPQIPQEPQVSNLSHWIQRLFK